MEFVREDTPVKFLSAEPKPSEGLYKELNFRKKKCLLSFSYNSNRSNIMNHLNALRSNLALSSTQYEHLLLLGDFSVEYKTPCMHAVFCVNLIVNPTCYKCLLVLI